MRHPLSIGVMLKGIDSSAGPVNVLSELPKGEGVGAADFITAMTRLSTDADFAQRLRRDPVGTTRDAGYNLTATELDNLKSATAARGSPPDSLDQEGQEAEPMAGAPNRTEETRRSGELQAEFERHRLERAINLSSYNVDLFKTTLNNAAKTYRSISLMCKVTFWLGVGLVIGSAIYGAVTGKQLLAAAFGSIGAGTIFALFLLGPIKRSQTALSNLVQSEIAFMNYFEQITFWDSYAFTPTGWPPALNHEHVARASAELQRRSSEAMALLEEFTETPSKAGTPASQAEWPEGSVANADGG
jgi:hypothetical protein